MDLELFGPIKQPSKQSRGKEVSQALYFKRFAAGLKIQAKRRTRYTVKPLRFKHKREFYRGSSPSSADPLWPICLYIIISSLYSTPYMNSIIMAKLRMSGPYRMPFNPKY